MIVDKDLNTRLDRIEKNTDILLATVESIIINTKQYHELEKNHYVLNQKVDDHSIRVELLEQLIDQSKNMKLAHISIGFLYVVVITGIYILIG